MSNPAEHAAGPEIERFAASSGRWFGFAGIVLGGVAAVLAGIEDFPDHWQVIGFGLAVAGLSWVVLVRPVVALHEHGVLLRNMLRDSFVPAAKIEAVKSSQTLMVRTDQATFHGLGVSQSVRTMMRENRGPRQNMMTMFGGMSGTFGAGGAAEPGEPVQRHAHEEHMGGSYPAYVESRIEKAAQEAKPDEREPVVAWALLPVAVLALSLVCVALLFV